MNSFKSNLQLIITRPDSDNIITSISGLSSVIRDIKDSINNFSAKHNDLKISNTNKGFILSPKAYMAVQHIIYEKIK